MEQIERSSLRKRRDSQKGENQKFTSPSLQNVQNKGFLWKI
jgi:hypothetical protein